MVASYITHSQEPAPRSLWSSILSVLLGILFVIPLANGASADVNSAIDKLLNGATDQIQSMQNLANTNCSGESRGQNPLSYDAYKAAGDTAIKGLGSLRVALAKGQTQEAGAQLNSVIGLLDRMIEIVHNNCSGGPSGVDVLNFPKILEIKQQLKGNLEAVKTILAG
ncbi:MULTISPECIES: hypothetical protein [unclassified Bradyrhizobium]|uniref:hypothetical protein n=1 Tax=unclassified Bradyrhizobium TaxID=2631580 RepID=UPI003395DC77